MLVQEKELFVKKIPGEGKANFILIHNAGGNHHFFTYQVETLKKFGNVILIDLPGHGNSEAIEIHSMKSVTDIIEKICFNLQLENITIMGLNNGANIAIEIAINTTLDIRNLILIDPPIFMDKTFLDEINQFIQVLEQDNLTSYVDTLTSGLFIKADEKTISIARDAFKNVDKKSLQQMFETLIKWDKESSGVMKKMSCPVLCILTDEHHCSYSKMKKEAPHIELGKVVGSKCWATLEVPDQINAMMARFLTLHC